MTFLSARVLRGLDVPDSKMLVDGKLVFSKKQAGRSPTAADIVRLVRPA